MITNKTDQKAEHANDIMQILNNGIEFYTGVQTKVDNPVIVGMFIIMAMFA